MLASSPFAISAAAAAPGGAGSIISGIAPLLLIFVIFYFLLIRPQQRRMKQHRDMLAAVKKNDVAVTSGGIVGKVTKVDEAEVELEIAAGVRVRVVKSMLGEVRPNSPKPAND
jgi:preprotein translocase subunit YajC